MGCPQPLKRSAKKQTEQNKYQERLLDSCTLSPTAQRVSGHGCGNECLGNMLILRWQSLYMSSCLLSCMSLILISHGLFPLYYINISYSRSGSIPLVTSYSSLLLNNWLLCIHGPCCLGLCKLNTCCVSIALKCNLYHLPQDPANTKASVRTVVLWNSVF